MSRRDQLGHLEQLVLWTALRLGPSAYGMEVHRSLVQRTGRPVAQGAVYVTLKRLERKEYVESTPEVRQGRVAGVPRRFIRVTPRGRRALRASRAALVAAWSGLESFVE